MRWNTLLVGCCIMWATTQAALGGPIGPVATGNQPPGTPHIGIFLDEPWTYEHNADETTRTIKGKVRVCCQRNGAPTCNCPAGWTCGVRLSGFTCEVKLKNQSTNQTVTHTLQITQSMTSCTADCVTFDVAQTFTGGGGNYRMISVKVTAADGECMCCQGDVVVLETGGTVDPEITEPEPVPCDDPPLDPEQQPDDESPPKLDWRKKLV